MKTLKAILTAIPVEIAVCLLALATPAARATTLWNGPITNFFHAEGGAGDKLTPGVIINRGSSGGLYNSVTEPGANAGVSPKDTMWNEGGSLSNYQNLTFTNCPLEESMRPPNRVNHTFVVHLVAEDIYFSLTLTAWGGQGGSGTTSFSYARTTPSAAPPAPSVTITVPTNGAAFEAPASVDIAATATVSSGTVTNVEFFSNGASLGSVQNPPFDLTASNIVVGTYVLTAVAMAGGISATSLVVNISVTNSAQPITITSPIVSVSGGQFTFSYSTDPGLSYVIESSSNLVVWLPVVTNLASGGSAPFSDSFKSTGAMYYRVGQLPSP
jgi:hypothetical protein